MAIRGLDAHVTRTLLTADPERASRGGWVLDEPDHIFGCKDLRCGGLVNGVHMYPNHRLELSGGGGYLLPYIVAAVHCAMPVLCKVYFCTSTCTALCNEFCTE